MLPLAACCLRQWLGLAHARGGTTRTTALLCKHLSLDPGFALWSANRVSVCSFSGRMRCEWPRYEVGFAQPDASWFFVPMKFHRQRA